MRAINLSLAHPVYKVDVNSITKKTIDMLNLKDEKKQTMLVCIFGDLKRYWINTGASNIDNTYYFTYNEAVAAQKKLRLDTLIRVDKAYQKASKRLAELKEQYEAENNEL